jgi:hypothetical protein
MTSPDGINWTIRTSGANNSWESVIFGNGKFVAVSSDGTGNRIMTSTDGITWSICTGCSTGFDNQWQGVTYGNGLFVAVSDSGTGNRVMTSPDGTTWTSRTSAVDNGWQSVTYGNGLFVAVAANTGTGNRIMTSPDGINWTIRKNPVETDFISVTYANGMFVAVGYNGSFYGVMTSGNLEQKISPDNNSYQGGITVYGASSLKSDGISTTPLSIDNSTTGINLLQVKDLSANFGSAVTGGAFIGRNSYFGEEFNVTKTSAMTVLTGSATVINCGWARGDMGGQAYGTNAACAATGNSTSGAGELNVSAKLGQTTAGDNCTITSISGVNGVERITANSTATATNSAACMEGLGLTNATTNRIYTAANLPVVTAKVKPSTLVSGNDNRRVMVGMAARDVAALGDPTDGIYFTNCSTYSATAPTGCSNTTWYGFAASGSASLGSVTCTGTMSTSQFAYLRIEVRKTGASAGEVHFYADVDTSNGVVETECGSGISGVTLSASGMTPFMEAQIADASLAAVALDVDYFRSWQDDNVPAQTILAMKLQLAMK